MRKSTVFQVVVLWFAQLCIAAASPLKLKFNDGKFKIALFVDLHYCGDQPELDLQTTQVKQ